MKSPTSLISSVYDLQDDFSGPAETAYWKDKALTDDVTGMSNRRHLLQKLAEAHDAQKSPDPRRTYGGDRLLMIDIDDFKKINDTYGHEAGNKALCTIAAFLKSSVRNTDVVARLGGDEFAVLLVGASEEGGKMKQAEITEGLNNLSFEWGVHKILIKGSVGVHPVYKALSPEAILAAADEHMYATKNVKKRAAAASVKGPGTPDIHPE